jgi:hypothetical protein
MLAEELNSVLSPGQTSLKYNSESKNYSFTWLPDRIPTNDPLKCSFNDKRMKTEE